MIELHLTRTLSAPPARVWQALTDPTALAAWFWPERLSPTVTTDLRAGGRFRITGDGMAVTGEYRELTEPDRLAFSWSWEGEDESTEVTIELRPAGTGTELVLRHTGHHNEADRDNHAKGWNDCLDRLPAWLTAEPTLA